MRKFFRTWNWEYDIGEGELPAQPLPAPPYAVAYYDSRGRLYRAEILEPPSPGVEGELRFVYDYFCDDSGRVLEKRALDTNLVVALIVSFVYGQAGEAPTQVAFTPESGEIRSAVVKDYLTKRRGK